MQLVLLGIVLLIAACRPPIRILAPSHDLVCGSASSTHRISVGAFLGDSARDDASMRDAQQAFAEKTRRPPWFVKIFRAFDEPLGSSFAAISRSGSIPLITIEPTWRGHPPDVLARIARGEADAMIRARAQEILAVTRDSVIIELAPEMNARFDAPWQSGGDSTRAIEYRAAWRRAVAVAREAGLTNAKWLWSPSAGNPYTNQPTGGTHWNWMDRYYPGDDVVDYVGLHAFNDAISQRAWVPFVELVDGDAADRALTTLIKMHPSKPIILGELASSELPGMPGAKGAWITAAFDAMSRCAPIAGVVWFDANKERDWRVNSSDATLAAYRAAILQTAR